MSEAVKKAGELTNEEDTLIVVTADHSHTFIINGYPHPDNDIFGNIPISDKHMCLSENVYASHRDLRIAKGYCKENELGYRIFTYSKGLVISYGEGGYKMGKSWVQNFLHPLLKKG